MLWLVIKGASHQIISSNIHSEKGKHQLWVERPNGKTLKVRESGNLQDVQEVKNAIDYAVKHKHSSLELE